MARNIELKARLNDLDAARVTAQRLATESPGVLFQIDTYFRVAHGRLKLRETSGAPTELVFYQRPNAATAKTSDYSLCPVSEPAALKAQLAAACGILVVVEKRRELYLHHNVRIHLDEVAGLGPFLEFEAVVGGRVSDDDARRQVESLTGEFRLTAEQLVSASYSDLLQGAG